MHATSSAAVFVLALTCAARPALPQEARACANEVQRLSEGLPLVHAEGREEDALAQEPSARKGASLPDERRKQIEDLVRQAGAAGEQGDGQGCLKGLAEARALLREAGLGSSQPGSATYGGPAGTGSAAGGAGAAGAPARSPSNNSAGSMSTRGAGSAGVAGDAVESGPTLPTGGGGAGDTTTSGGASGGIGGGGGGATGGSSGGGSR